MRRRRKKEMFNNFEHLGKKFLSQMRVKISTAEDKIDLENFFSRTITNFLREAFSGKMAIGAESVVFAATETSHYLLKPTLANQMQFKEVWNSSNLSAVIGRMATSTYHRYMHLSKHPEKTVLKIR